ncbi:hypothetical protein QMJ44_001044 [Campylobacter jejuni]|nr:hypothetical protein [Campylobacter jejuni]HEB5708581.1 hypothetical protein [Campylobacter jejuni]HEB8438945.1 hypothetical protein [Campylobacter jejuni]HEB8440801.1 hypothetical protein [Campylobacter jejuni]
MQKNITSNLILTNEQVAINYGLTTGSTIAKHLRTHNDEFIENTHYFLVENSFKNKTIKWTLEGVYKLFDKIKKLKERSKMAEEKESKGSNLIQLKVSDKAKEYLQERADSLGFALNTYIYHLIMKDMETFNQR